MVLCGNCRLHHESPEAVRACYGLAPITSPQRSPRSAASSSMRTLRSSQTRPWRAYRPVPTGFDLERPAVVYLMANAGLRSLKIGVTATNRIEEHEAFDWELIDHWWFTCGYDAVEIEELVLDRWRNVFSLRPTATNRDMPQGGASETTADTPAARADIKKLVDSFYRERCGERSGHDLAWNDDPWFGTEWEGDLR